MTNDDAAYSRYHNRSDRRIGDHNDIRNHQRRSMMDVLGQILFGVKKVTDEQRAITAGFKPYLPSTAARAVQPSDWNGGAFLLDNNAIVHHPAHWGDTGGITAYIIGYKPMTSVEKIQKIRADRFETVTSAPPRDNTGELLRVGVYYLLGGDGVFYAKPPPVDPIEKLARDLCATHRRTTSENVTPSKEWIDVARHVQQLIDAAR